MRLIRDIRDELHVTLVHPFQEPQVISNLDLYAEAGGNATYVTENQVTVSDGEINIEFVAVTENALINAIKVSSDSSLWAPLQDKGIFIHIAGVNGRSKNILLNLDRMAGKKRRNWKQLMKKLM